MKRLSLKKTIALCCISGLVAIFMIVTTVVTSIFSTGISSFFNQETSKIVNRGEPIYTSDYSSPAKLRIRDEAVCLEIESEGIVLLKNDTPENSEAPSLPLEKGAKISVFGQGSEDFLYGGTQSDTSSVKSRVSFIDGLTDSGFSVNPVLRKFYTSGNGSSYRRVVPPDGTVNAAASSFAINEVPVYEYNDEVIESFSEYNAAAVVVIGRSGLIGSDLPRVPLDSGYYYLEPDERELAMIEFAATYFDNVVVLINSANPMQLGSLAENENVDSALWVGNPGSTGAYAIGRVLNGYTNPSGRLPDTYAYDFLRAPSTVNLGDYVIRNAPMNTSNVNRYMVYAEGIYVGYRYYETRYEDTVFGRSGAVVTDFDYAQEVLYPFGYGLSYTEFEYSGFSVAYVAAEDVYEVRLNVTNTGDKDGKETVQIYMQSPYDEESGIETPSVELVGYAKTDTLAPEETANVTVRVSADSLGTYDKNGVNVRAGGKYYFTAAYDAHHAINNIIARKESEGETVADRELLRGEGDAGLAAVTEDIPTVEGEGESGIFAAADISAYDETYTGLSRKNWAETFPESSYKEGSWFAPKELTEKLVVDDSYKDSETELPETGVIDESNQNLSAFYLLQNEVAYGDERYRALIKKLTVSEMSEFVRMGGYSTLALEKINLPETKSRYGTTGISEDVFGVRDMTYPTQPVVAATFNAELVEELGKCMSEDMLYAGITGIFAPGLNIHRSAYGGGNYENYSEDSLLCGKTGAALVRGVRNKMGYAIGKYFGLQAQETNKWGVSIFADEQTIRELYLEPFRIAVTEGGMTAVMTSASRVGTVWSGAHKGLLTDVLRGEWGFKGMVMTDQSMFGGGAHMDIGSGLCAGSDLWFNTNSVLWRLSAEQLQMPAIVEALQRASENIAYTVIRSSAMNGLTENSDIERIIPTWQGILIALDIILLSACLAVFVFVTVNRIATGRNKNVITTEIK